jgi:hypothetical protein
MLNTFAILPR